MEKQSRESKFILHAYNVHQGGGKHLLLNLLHPKNFPFFKIVHLDQRLPFVENLPSEVECIRVRPSLLSRFFCELKLFLSAKKDDLVLCFGSLPPLFPLSSKIILFVHNKYNISPEDHKFLKGRVRFQAWIERIWFSLFSANVDLFVVQTPTMKRDLISYLNKEVDVKVLNLFNPPFFSKKTKNLKNLNSKFIYVASGNPNKNHKNLIAAWILLAKENIFPMLTLTLGDNYIELIKLIKMANLELGAKIHNLGNTDYDQIVELYSCSDVLIFPSVLESLGLPLLEAQHYGLDILAPEKDYVRDLVIPNETFDPSSPQSIAHSIKRYLGMPATQAISCNGNQFLQEISNHLV